MKDNGGPAFPGGIDHGASGVESFTGMTLRDYFAVHAPPEAFEIGEWTTGDCMEYLEVENFCWAKHRQSLFAKLAYEYADAMLKEREK